MSKNYKLVSNKSHPSRTFQQKNTSLLKFLNKYSQLFRFVELLFPVTHLMAYYAKTDCSCSPRRGDFTDNSNIVFRIVCGTSTLTPKMLCGHAVQESSCG